MSLHIAECMYVSKFTVSENINVKKIECMRRHYNGGYLSLHICPNSSNIQHQD